MTRNRKARPMPQLRFTKEQLIDALEARRPWAQQRDIPIMAKHRQAEKAYLTAFRRSCREALTWDYQQVKANRAVQVIDERGKSLYPPTCPTLTEATLDRQLNIIRSARDGVRLTVSEGGQWSQVFWLLTHDDSIAAEAC